MIIQILFQLLFTLASTLLSFFPGWGIYPLPLPWGLDPVFSTMVSYYHGAIETLPYLAIGFEMFLYLLGFELAMLFLKLFLGSRTPMHSSN